MKQMCHEACAISRDLLTDWEDMVHISYRGGLHELTRQLHICGELTQIQQTERETA